MPKMAVRGIPILLLSLLLVGVGGGLSFAQDTATEILQLRLETERALAAMGNQDLADEMARQLPDILAETVDRVSFDLPEPTHFDQPRAAEILRSKLEEAEVHQRLAALANFKPSIEPVKDDGRRLAKADNGQDLARRLEDRKSIAAIGAVDRRHGALVQAARVRFEGGLIKVTSALVTTPSGITSSPTGVTVTPGSGAVVNTPASPPGQAPGGPGNSGNNGKP